MWHEKHVGRSIALNALLIFYYIYISKTVLFRSIKQKKSIYLFLTIFGAITGYRLRPISELLQRFLPVNHGSDLDLAVNFLRFCHILFFFSKKYEKKIQNLSFF